MSADVLYLIRSDRYIKIGVASDLDYRIRSLQIGNPNRLQLEASFKVGEARALESVFHKLYKHKRVAGEWYSLSKDEVMNIGRICKIYIGTRRDKRADYIKELSVKFKRERKGLSYHRT